MQEIFEKSILTKKSKITSRQGFQALVFFDDKICLTEKQKIYPAQANVYFVKNTKLDVLWGTREKIVFDVQNEFFHVGLSGEMQIQIKNFRKFFNDVLIDKQKFDEDDLQQLVVPVVASQLDIFLKKYVSSNNLDPLKIETFKSEMSRNFRIELSQKLENMYGIACNNFMTLRVLVDELELEKIKQKNLQILMNAQLQSQNKKTLNTPKIQPNSKSETNTQTQAKDCQAQISNQTQQESQSEPEMLLE